ncbi:MAG: hypothetical protein LBH74_05975 [Nitrososphaerota archaeon]|jgi:phosphoribosyl-dephospho-CoA transferase|uniref:hypothetical protein n=1 Tax=Candidatus Bathycorpusculum sp. TaxID=2994959 RepID=UPI0028381181|nr:hypothetical protein [Candidatus Termitimicrobium sp.]MCL2432553.1 hypothetical protein [Candidatus Termitimicrobium sp.]MDR0493165.1 hypothetical protein [Nitrososphaerota archaeon]
MESIKDVISDSIYGIATVQPDHAVKKCRIRRMLIEYYLNEVAFILVIPRSCGDCEKVDDCTDEFIIQIIEKFRKNNSRYISN